jgi:hypothetical protein
MKLIGGMPFYKQATPTGFYDAALPRKISDAHWRKAAKFLELAKMAI